MFALVFLLVLVFAYGVIAVVLLRWFFVCLFSGLNVLWFSCLLILFVVLGCFAFNLFYYVVVWLLRQSICCLLLVLFVRHLIVLYILCLVLF